MTQPTVHPHTLWLDRKPSNGPVDAPDWRRVLRVTAADPDGYVVGIGWWQQEIAGRWRDSPASSRKTRVRHGSFVKRYEPAGEAS